MSEERGSLPPPEDAGARLVEILLTAAGEHVVGILLFGSHLARTGPESESAWDFVVVVDRYAPFHRDLVRAGLHSRSPHTLTALARVLPPNVLSFAPEAAGGALAKCLVVTQRDFQRALAPRARDHFLKGRMVQRVAILHARDEGAASWLRDRLRDARRDVLRWMAPHLPEPFSASDLVRGMLRVSYRGEVRPEAQGRVREVFEAQREVLVPEYQRLLVRACSEGRLERADDGGYRLARRPGMGQRLGNRLYFFRSKLRATARWVKHVLTYDDWLEYIRRKVERRTGLEVELTRLERRYPLIFLWPKVVKVLRARSARRELEGEG